MGKGSGCRGTGREGGGVGTVWPVKDGGGGAKTKRLAIGERKKITLQQLSECEENILIRRPSVATERRQEEVRNGGDGWSMGEGGGVEEEEGEEEAEGFGLNSHSSSLHEAEMILLTPEL